MTGHSFKDILGSWLLDAEYHVLFVSRKTVRKSFCYSFLGKGQEAVSVLYKIRQLCSRSFLAHRGNGLPLIGRVGCHINKRLYMGIIPCVRDDKAAPGMTAQNNVAASQFDGSFCRRDIILERRGRVLHGNDAKPLFE